jgi:hypothetical protein
MTDNSKQSRSRNVVVKNIIAIFVVVGLLLPLTWLEKRGVKWTAYLIPLIPIIALAYWLMVPTKMRDQAVKDAQVEIGRVQKYLMRVFFVVVAVMIMVFLAMWL